MFKHFTLARILHHHEHPCRVVKPAIQPDNVGMSRTSTSLVSKSLPELFHDLYSATVRTQSPPLSPFGPGSASPKLRYGPFEDISAQARSLLPVSNAPDRLFQSGLRLATSQYLHEPLPSGRPISKSARLHSLDGPALPRQPSLRIYHDITCQSHPLL